jgi:hypothetical protein
MIVITGCDVAPLVFAHLVMDGHEASSASTGSPDDRVSLSGAVGARAFPRRKGWPDASPACLFASDRGSAPSNEIGEG